MDIDFQEFEFINGMWHAVFNRPVKFDFWMNGTETNLTAQQLKIITLFLNSIDSHVIEASDFIKHSVYSDEMEEYGGITLNGIDFDSLNDFKVWFNFKKWKGGMIAVRFKEQKPIDVYCDKK